MRLATEVIPGVVSALIVIGLTLSLINTHRRALNSERRVAGAEQRAVGAESDAAGADKRAASAESRATDSESQLALVLKFRGMTPEDLEELQRLDTRMRNGS